MPELSSGSQWPFMVLAGAGVGLVLSPANGMAAAMVVAFVVALIWMPSGKAPDLDDS